MSRRKAFDPELEQTVIAMRRAGRTCEDVATECGIREQDVWLIMRHNDLNGKIRNYKPHKRSTKNTLEYALTKADVMTIEVGIGGGYIVTLDEEWTGEVCDTVPAAIRSAAAVME